MKVVIFQVKGNSRGMDVTLYTALRSWDPDSCSENAHNEIVTNLQLKKFHQEFKLFCVVKV
jgi:hypothetical protein